jgi:hypothetical protein
VTVGHDMSERGRWPVTMAEWEEKVPGWLLHDVEGFLVAVQGPGVVFLRADSAFDLHVLVCEHEGTENDRPFVDAATFDRVHKGTWQRQCKYGVHWCVPAGTLWCGGEYIDFLARQCITHDEARPGTQTA